MRTQLLLMRHGETANSGYADDDLRRLTPRGKLMQKIMAERLKEVQLIPDKIYSSSLIRAVESAEIVGQVLGIAVEQTPALGLDFNKEALFNLIEMHFPKRLLFVGHMPTLPQFLNTLVGKKVLNVMKQSSLAIVDISLPLKNQASLFLDYIECG